MIVANFYGLELSRSFFIKIKLKALFTFDFSRSLLLKIKIEADFSFSITLFISFSLLPKINPTKNQETQPLTKNLSTTLSNPLKNLIHTQHPTTQLSNPIKLYNQLYKNKYIFIFKKVTELFKGVWFYIYILIYYKVGYRVIK